MSDSQAPNNKDCSSLSLSRLIKGRNGFPNRIWKSCLRLADYKFPVRPSAKLSEKARQEIKLLLRPGDILLESNNAHPISQLLSQLFFGSSWIHSAIYVASGEIVDAGRKASVVKVSVDTFLDTTDIAVYRPKYTTADDAQQACRYALQQVGRPFNYRFDDADNHSFYCAQLVASALRSTTNAIHLEQCQLCTARVFNCASIVRSPQMQCVWSSKPELLTNLGSHWPILIGAVAGASLLSFFIRPFTLVRSLCRCMALVGALLGMSLVTNFLRHRYKKTK